MTDKTLRSKAIDIRGKRYVLVSDRINYFNETYKNGFIETRLLSQPDSQMVVMKAKVTPDADKPTRCFIGHSQAKWGEGMVNKTAALENAETSAVGRALGMMGIGVIDSVASADEIKKAEKSDPIMQVTKGMGSDKPASEGQRKMIFAIAKEAGFDTDKTKEIVKTNFNLDSFNDLTTAQAKTAIEGFLRKAKK